MKDEPSLAVDFLRARIERLPANYREQKSKEQRAFQEAARGNPEMVKSAWVLSGLAKDAVLVQDPYDISERERYGY
ncbi:MAG: hypothetical protein Q8O64_05830 [Sideroxyarcus sp.]|nr:hypothetical protein [Sideroxyarcus sp.]